MHFRKEVMAMKIEKLNNRQIRCVLTKEDLMQRELRISELAYGTDKAKALFHDMMAEASELWFEAEDIPLMIEAIPVSSESLELIVPKVEDPDELDTRFSKFTEFDEMEYDDEEDEEDFHFVSEDTENEFGSEIPFGEPLSEKQYQKKEEIKPQAQIFTFRNLDDLIHASGHAASAEYVRSSLYREEEQGQYYLVVEQDEWKTEEYEKVCNCILEYGRPVAMNQIQLVSLKEHTKLIMEHKAMVLLAGIEEGQ